MADTRHDGWEDVFRGVFEIKLNTTDGTESHSTCRADKLEKENESLYKLVDDLQDKLVKKDEKHADEIKYWRKVADEFSNAGMKAGAENGALKDQINRLEDRLDFCTKARDRLEKENKRLNEELSGYAHKLVDAEAEIAAHKKRLAELSNAVVNANAATSNLKKELLERVNSKLKDELETVKDQLNKWARYGIRLEARNAELIEAYDNIEMNLNKKEQENVELKTRIGGLQKELDEVASTNIKLGKEVNDLQMNEQKLRGGKYNLAAQISIAIEDNNRLRKALDRTQINDEAIIPILHKLNKAFVESVSDKADFGEWLQAYSHFCALCDAFSEIYYIVDEKYPEEHIFELIDDFLLEAKDYFGKRFAAQIKPEPKEDNAKENN